MPADLPPVISIPAGRIELRDARSGRSRQVSLRAFEIGRTPVTAAEYRAVADGPRPREASETVTPAPPPSQPDGSDADVPVHPITWFDAVRWCNAASTTAGLEAAYVVEGRDVAWNVAAGGFRLPTEAEWEFACRAGSPGATYGPLVDIAWAAADEVDGPQPVARKAPNDFGLFDTLGNVWEWCWDYADTARYGDYRSLRGGGWADRGMERPRIGASRERPRRRARGRRIQGRARAPSATVGESGRARLVGRG